MAEKSLDVIKTRELGGTPEAEKIRALVVRKSEEHWLPLSSLLLASIARYEHTENLIKPALAAGKIVLSDRYADSTYVYQVLQQGADENAFRQLYALTLGDFKPDLTLVFDLPTEISIIRARTDVQIELFKERASEKASDRFEQTSTETQEKVRQAYLDIAKNNPDRCVVVNAAQDVDKVADDVWTIVKERLNLS